MLHQSYWAECKWPFWVQSSPVRGISIPSTQQDMGTVSFLPWKNRQRGRGGTRRRRSVHTWCLPFQLPSLFLRSLSFGDAPLCHSQSMLGRGSSLPQVGRETMWPRLGQSVYCIAWAKVIGSRMYLCDPVRYPETQWAICWEPREGPSLTFPKGVWGRSCGSHFVIPAHKPLSHSQCSSLPSWCYMEQRPLSPLKPICIIDSWAKRRPLLF